MKILITLLIFLIFSSNANAASYLFVIPISGSNPIVSWDEFADSNGLPKGAGGTNPLWDDLYWSNTGLTELPNGEYPRTTLTSVELQDNNISSITGFDNVTFIRWAYLNGNSFADFSGFSGTVIDYLIMHSNLGLVSLDGLEANTSAKDWYIYSNPNLSDISALSNLVAVKDFDLSNNPNLQDLSPISNIGTMEWGLFMDNREYTVKADGAGPFCQNILSGTYLLSSSTGDVDINFACQF